MALRVFTVFTFLFMFLWSCSNGQETNNNSKYNHDDSSRVERFEYGGYSDTIYAMIYGKVYEVDKKTDGSVTRRPVALADIKVLENGKIVQTDSTGQFQIGLEKGNYSFTVSKQGYESITLTNYVSDPDQVSSTKIIIAKGTKSRAFRIRQWTR